MAVPNVTLIASSEGPVSGDLFDDKKAFSKSLTSEIVIALCGPMGTPLHEVAQTFQKLLLSNDFGYEEVVILRLSDEIRRIKDRKVSVASADSYIVRLPVSDPSSSPATQPSSGAAFQTDQHLKQASTYLPGVWNPHG